MKSNVFLIVSIFSLLIMSGCSSRQVQVKNSGFFENYNNLELSTKMKLDKGKKIFVSPVVVISSIPENLQSKTQKDLYKKVSEYLTRETIKILSDSSRYILTNKTTTKYKLDIAVSAVEVHLDDKSWNNNTPISFGLDVVSYNSYLDSSVRVLGESRLVDISNEEVLERFSKIQKDTLVTINSDILTFEDFKESLDAWLESFREYIK